jgi:hypothetical protein
VSAEALDQACHAVFRIGKRPEIDFASVSRESKTDPTPVGAVSVSLDPVVSDQRVGNLGEARKTNADRASKLRSRPVADGEGPKREKLIGRDSFVAVPDGYL